MLPTGLSGCVHSVKTHYVWLYPIAAFTLIELLIAVAIILILISIALPNFLEAQLRAKVAKVKGELHGIKTALETYHLDYNDYPAMQSFKTLDRETNGLYWLTTPTAFMSSTLMDPFGFYTDSGLLWPYEMGGRRKGSPKHWSSCLVTWVLFSCGPDFRCEEFSVYENPHVSDHKIPVSYSYCPTNGTWSKGDIFLWGGDPHWIGVFTNIQYGTDAKVGKCVDDVWYLHTMPPSLR